jgi:hypothetical protein
LHAQRKVYTRITQPMRQQMQRAHRAFRPYVFAFDAAFADAPILQMI